jgi:MFS family permease
MFRHWSTATSALRLNRAKPNNVSVVVIVSVPAPHTGPAPNLVAVLQEHPVFRAIWLAGLVSLIGSWMQNLGAAWLMTDLSTSPAMVGLVQTAQSLPGLTLALIAGALSDMFDRRKFLIAIMAWQTLVTAALAVMTALGLVTPWILLAFVFAVGVGGACQVPAMAATLQEIVPRDKVIGAVTLNSISMNISRAIGPSLAGFLVAGVGTAAAFLVNSLSYAVFMVVVAFRIPRAQLRQTPRQSFYATLISGLMYARRAKRFQAVMIRGFSFFLFGSAVMSLLPFLARQELGVTASTYGPLVGFVGLGAVITAFILVPYLTPRFSRDRIVLVSSIIVGLCLLVMGWIHTYAVFAVVLIFFGGAWMISMMSFQVSSQMVLPAWVRGRGISMSMMSFTSGMACAGVLWGQVAHYTNLTVTFTAAGIGLIITALITHRFKIGSNETEDV